jgi:hypothetical protein
MNHHNMFIDEVVLDMNRYTVLRRMTRHANGALNCRSCRASRMSGSPSYTGSCMAGRRSRTLAECG